MSCAGRGGGGDIIDLTNINPKLEGRRSWKRCVIMADVCPEYEAIIYFILFYFTLHFYFFYSCTFFVFLIYPLL